MTSDLLVGGHGAMVPVCALGVAIGVDLLWGEPAARFHPVVWMGRFLGFFGQWAAPVSSSNPPPSDWGAFLRGMVSWWLGGMVVLAVASGLVYIAGTWPAWITALWLGFLLKPMLAWRMLREEVMAVDEALKASIQAGRERLSYLCSRDVSTLDATLVRETAIETLAENLNDSVVAPLFWFALLGLPGAALYRFANTADAMWGYRGDRAGRHWEWTGKWAAWMDDVLSWVPARLTAVLLVMASGRWWLKRLHTEAQVTPSPNGGWPMAAMALLLGVRLRKSGVYVLNSNGRAPVSMDVVRACRLAVRALGLSVLVGWLLIWGGYG